MFTYNLKKKPTTFPVCLYVFHFSNYPDEVNCKTPVDGKNVPFFSMLVSFFKAVTGKKPTMKSYLEKQRIFIQRENLFQSLLEFKACVWGHLFPNEPFKMDRWNKDKFMSKKCLQFSKIVQKSVWCVHELH